MYWSIYLEAVNGNKNQHRNGMQFSNKPTHSNCRYIRNVSQNAENWRKLETLKLELKTVFNVIFCRLELNRFNWNAKWTAKIDHVHIFNGNDVSSILSRVDGTRTTWSTSSSGLLALLLQRSVLFPLTPHFLLLPRSYILNISGSNSASSFSILLQNCVTSPRPLLPINTMIKRHYYHNTTTYFFLFTIKQTFTTARKTSADSILSWLESTTEMTTIN